MSSFDDDEALFEDIYGDDEAKEETVVKPEPTIETEVKKEDSVVKEETEDKEVKQEGETEVKTEEFDQNQNQNNNQNNNGYQNQNHGFQDQGQSNKNEFYSRDQGKMFIGGLNWDTTEEGLKEYFNKYGEIIDFTIMRDGANGKSRGFGFLTFKESKSVDEVLKTDHILDGKLIDPKRAIPREEQDKTGKIFVGGIGPEVNEKDFNDFFSTFGNVIDAQLMIDKDTGRSRGFGFVTYDSPEAVDRVTVSKYLNLKGKAMEVKRAEPRGQQQNNYGNNNNSNNYNNRGGYQNQNQNSYQQQQQPYQQSFQQQQQQQPMGMGAYGNMNMPGMSPEMMAQYWQQMQQWYAAQYQQSGAVAPQQFQQFQQQIPNQPQLPLNPQQGANTITYDDQVPPPPPNPQSRSAPDYGQDYQEEKKPTPPPNAPKGPKAPTRNFQRNRGFRGRGGYHPYSRGGGKP